MRIAGLVVVAGLMVTAVALAVTPANAALVISQNPSSNLTCIRGTCTATAADAVLNVKDLHKLLKAADTRIVSGSAARDIEFDAALTWTSNSRLTVDAYRSILFTNGVTSEGMGGVTLITNDGGSGGDYSFRDKGRLAFWDLSSSLIINGNAYTLVNDLKTLSTDVANAPAGFYALARAIQQTGKSPTVKTSLQGTFEGLGHSISGMTLEARGTYAGLFAQTESGATIRDVDIKDADASYGRHTLALGILVGRNGGLAGANEGTIDQSHATGTVSSRFGDSTIDTFVGGLAGWSDGSITRSFATGAVTTNGGYDFNHLAFAGGLAGQASKVDQSFATGPVRADTFTYAGGLVGEMPSDSAQVYITNSYSTGSVTGEVNDDGAFGGFAGWIDAPVSTSYSTGAMSDSGRCGGFFGIDASDGLASATYWDLDTSGISDPSRGAVSPPNDPGITGLSDAQLKSGLPAGFDPQVWGQNAAINNGYPYLLANPPQ